MNIQDPIADMLTRIRNAQAVNKQSVAMPHSKLKAAVAKVLKEEGYITDYKVEDGGKPTLIVILKYHAGRPVIEKIQRLSRPGIRRYAAVDELPKILGGLGISIVSTSKGVVSDRVARQLNVGGELLCEVW